MREAHLDYGIEINIGSLAICLKSQEYKDMSSYYD